MALSIRYAVARQIANHSCDCAPQEACGLLAGAPGRITAAYPLRNFADAPDEAFRADPTEQWQALKAMEADGLEWIGVYHSHPASEPIPSRRDIDECADGGLPQLIVSLAGAKPRLKLWRVAEHSATPIDLVFETAREAEFDRPLSPAQRSAIVVVALAALLILLLISFSLLPPAPEIP